jgi:hypothetical protein
MQNGSYSDERGDQNQSLKHEKMNSILVEYEKTKRINDGMMRSIGSPKGPVFSRVSATPK